MDNFLQKSKLSDELTTELDISRSDFISAFERNVEPSDLGFFSNPFEAFSSSKKMFKGNISFDGFTIKRRRTFINRNTSGAKGIGTFTERNGKLVVHTQINGFSHFTLMISMLLFVYLLLLIIFLASGNIDREVYFVIPFIIGHGALMITILYFVMKRSVSRLKYELEREFFYWTKK